MKIKTSQELDERIEQMTRAYEFGTNNLIINKGSIMLLLRDFSESIVPEKIELGPTEKHYVDGSGVLPTDVYNQTIDTIQENSNRLLGEEKQ